MKRKYKYKYVEVTVVREQRTPVFLRVPEDVDITEKLSKKSFLTKVCKETLQNSSWDETGWEDTVAWEEVKEVSKTDAEKYSIFKA